MESIAGESISKQRLIAGGAVFLAGQLAPLAIPLVAASGLPTSWKSAISGFLLLGLPEIGILLAVVILGKAGFNALKSRLFGSLKETLLPSHVSRWRYYLGLVFFMIPVLFAWISPYVYESLPEMMRHRLTLAVVGDLILIASVVIMGGQFWEKLRALFVYDPDFTVSPSTNDAVG